MIMAGFAKIISATFIGPEGSALRAMEQWSGEALTIALVVIALVVLIFALQPGHNLTKAILLGWLLMP